MSLNSKNVLKRSTQVREQEQFMNKKIESEFAVYDKDDNLYCKICNLKISNVSFWTKHLASRKHKLSQETIRKAQNLNQSNESKKIILKDKRKTESIREITKTNSKEPTKKENSLLSDSDQPISIKSSDEDEIYKYALEEWLKFQKSMQEQEKIAEDLLRTSLIESTNYCKLIEINENWDPFDRLEIKNDENLFNKITEKLVQEFDEREYGHLFEERSYNFSNKFNEAKPIENLIEVLEPFPEESINQIQKLINKEDDLYTCGVNKDESIDEDQYSSEQDAFDNEQEVPSNDEFELNGEEVSNEEVVSNEEEDVNEFADDNRFNFSLLDDFDKELNEKLNDKTSLKEFYKVEKILAKRCKKNRRMEYLVKYENLDDDQVIWESEKTLDSKLIKEFNDKYGDKLLLVDLDKKTNLKYFDKRIDRRETGEIKVEDVDLKDLIKASINNPLCKVYNNVNPERIIGVYEFEKTYYFLIKWCKLTKADLFECEKFKQQYPEVVLKYYESKMMFCDLEEKRQSDAIAMNKRVFLDKRT